VVHLTVRARATPDGYFGRITGIAGVVGQLTNGISMAWLGLALRLARGRTTFVVVGLALLAVAACVALLPKPPLPASAEDPATASPEPSDG
jgi:hypothetical protein